MRFSQLVALVLVLGSGLTLSFDVSAKPSWKDSSSTTEKPGNKKNRGAATDPVVDTTTDTTTTDPAADTTTDTTTSDPAADTTTDTTTTEPVVDTTTDTTTTEPVVDTTTDTTTTEPVVDTSTDTTTTEPVVDTTTDTTTTEPTISGTATLIWNVPVSRENGDYLPINELYGYKVLVRDTANNTEFFVIINDPTTTQWDFIELTPGIWEFSIASIDTQGIYSSYSAVASKTID